MNNSPSIRLYLLRHPRVADASLCYGRLDVPLAPDWMLQARALISSLPAYSVIVSSPSGRCRALAEKLRTAAKDGAGGSTGESEGESKWARRWRGRDAAGAAIAAAAAPIESSTMRPAADFRAMRFPAVRFPAVRFDERLMEMNFGQWEGRPWHQIDREELDWWKTDLVNRAPPGGEALADVQLRVASWLTELRREWAGQRVLCITHSGVIRCLIAQATGRPLPQMMRQKVDFLAMSELHIDDRKLKMIQVNQAVSRHAMPRTGSVMSCKKGEE